MRMPFVGALLAALGLLAQAQTTNPNALTSSSANEISYSVVRASQLQYLNAGDVAGLKALLQQSLRYDARALAARVAHPELATPLERAQSLRALRLIAAMHERYPLISLDSEPEVRGAFELAKADNPCEFALNQKRDWAKPLQPLWTAECETMRSR